MTDAPLILVVDDIEDNRYTLTRRLKREGYERIIEATNGREALEKLESENVDLVLLDIMSRPYGGRPGLTSAARRHWATVGTSARRR